MEMRLILCKIAQRQDFVHRKDYFPADSSDSKCTVRIPSRHSRLSDRPRNKTWQRRNAALNIPTLEHKRVLPYKMHCNTISLRHLSHWWLPVDRGLRTRLLNDLKMNLSGWSQQFEVRRIFWRSLPKVLSASHKQLATQTMKTQMIDSNVAGIISKHCALHNNGMKTEPPIEGMNFNWNKVLSRVRISKQNWHQTRRTADQSVNSSIRSSGFWIICKNENIVKKCRTHPKRHEKWKRKKNCSSKKWNTWNCAVRFMIRMDISRAQRHYHYSDVDNNVDEMWISAPTPACMLPCMTNGTTC